MNWGEFGREMDALVERVDWRPDCIVAVVRGGVIPAAVFANKFNIRKLYIIKVSHVGEERKIKREFTPPVFEKKVLLVEDSLNSGKSLAAAKAYLEGKGAEVRTACLYTSPRAVIKPDFVLREFAEAPEFPWE